ncbi:MAG: hypothetical protein HKN67_12625 [Saprospiraceae bacterium]|nr:hypothetical protein [Saprospiraceae bacterium]
MSQEILEGIHISDSNRTSILLASWFCFTGFLLDYENAEAKSIEYLRDFLNSSSTSLGNMKAESLISQYYHPKLEDDIAHMIFKDALVLLEYGSNYKVAQNLKAYELELNSGVVKNESEFQAEQLARLLNAKLSTPYTLNTYGHILSQNILSTRKRIQRASSDNSKQKTPIRFEGIEEGIPNRGIQSFFRSNYRVHINLSAIADNKANIMISVNAIIISVLISLLSYRNIAETHPQYILPVVIFIFTGLASLIFAVLSARPKITYPNKNVVDKNIQKRNIIFFGSFVTMKLDRYEEIMDEVFREDHLIYGNMIRDMYNLGKVLDKKYQSLVISYNIFMIGFALTVLTFLATLFL